MSKAEQWQRLCDEHGRARAEYFDACTLVHAGFHEVYNGNQAANPTDQQLEREETAWKKWDDVVRRMRQFGKDNA